MTFEIIWYEMTGEKARDIVTAENENDALRQGYLKYNGNPPAKMHTIIRK